VPFAKLVARLFKYGQESEHGVKLFRSNVGYIIPVHHSAFHLFDLDVNLPGVLTFLEASSFQEGAGAVALSRAGNGLPVNTGNHQKRKEPV
jgi:hypothetical protein